MRIRSRDEAFESFFHSEVAGLQRFATFMCGDPDVAADLTQEALTRAYKRWLWMREAEAGAYVRRIIVNLLRDRHRRDSARKRNPLHVPDSVPSNTGEVEDWMVLSQALRALSPPRRAAVVLRFYEDMSEHQIAATLNRPLGTVKSDLHRALRDLRLLARPKDEPVKEST